MRFLLFGLALSAWTASASSFNISNVFSSHAVLQRGKPVVVWGWVSAPSPGIEIAATWVDGQRYAATADSATGLFRVRFPAAEASLAPFNLTFTSSAGGPADAVELNSLLLGDVFLCAGQSNMASVQVQALHNASDVVAAAAAPALQNGLRIFTAGTIPGYGPAPPTRHRGSAPYPEETTCRGLGQARPWGRVG